jgi:pyruvate dehydrogenase E1 component beta subunit
MPATPFDAKGLLIASIEDNNPVIFLEHRWLYNLTGPVPPGIYRVPLGEAQILREGMDLTIVGISYMTLEALRAAEMLAREDIRAEVIDLRTLRPFDEETVLSSVRKTGRLIVADTGTSTCGFGAEVVARATEKAFDKLKAAPARIGLPDSPTPTTPALARHYYPRAVDIVRAARKIMGLSKPEDSPLVSPSIPLDVPDVSFTGPF